jgi:hypothetical protein
MKQGPTPETGETLSFGMSGYRERLFDLIPVADEDVKFSNDETVVIAFEDESVLAIPFGAYKGSGERAIFSAPKHRLCVW